MPVKPVPEGYHTVTPSLILDNAAEAIEFYKKALGATEIMRMPAPGGKIGHAEIKIGDSTIFISDEWPNMGGKAPKSVGAYTGGLYLYVPDVDRAFDRAIKAGGKSGMPVQDMFWGDRMGSFTDPYGHQWTLATHVKDLSPEQIEEGSKAFQKQMQEQAQKRTA